MGLRVVQATLPSPNPAGGYTPPAPQSMLQQLRLNFEAEQRAYHAFLNNCFSKVVIILFNLEGLVL